MQHVVVVLVALVAGRAGAVPTAAYRGHTLRVTPRIQDGLTLLSVKDTNSTGQDLAPWVQRGSPIVFGMMTGKEVARERALPKLQTWCKDANEACVVFSDAWDDDVRPWVVDLVNFGYSANYLSSLEPYDIAQKRFIPALSILRSMVNINYRGKFARTEFVMLVDDDTYVFYEGLRFQVLPLLWDPTSVSYYTGQIAPKTWFPVKYNGAGKIQEGVGVGSWVPFALGGGGSLFSIAAANTMNLSACILESFPGMVWEYYLSDWMIGACAARYGITPTEMSRSSGSSPFNQFVCADPSREAFRYCSLDVETSGKDAWGDDVINHDHMIRSAGSVISTFHPVKDNASTWFVRDALGRLEPTYRGREDVITAFEHQLSATTDLKTFYRSYYRNHQAKRVAAREGVAAEDVEADRPRGFEDPDKRQPGAMDTAWMWCEYCPDPLKQDVVPV
jgi:hypothetical protein